MARTKRNTRRVNRTVRPRRTNRTVRRLSNSSSKTILSPYALGNALGLVSALLLAFYAVMSWLSSYNPSIIISQYPIPFSFGNLSLIIGLFQTYVMGYIGGWIFAKIYNK